MMNLNVYMAPPSSSSSSSPTRDNPTPFSMSGAFPSTPPPDQIPAAPDLDSPTEAFFASVSPLRIAAVPFAAIDESDLLYSPSDHPTSTIPPDLPIPMPEGEFFCPGGGSSSPRESLRGPEFSCQRLIETIHRIHPTRLSSSRLFGVQRSDFSAEEQFDPHKSNYATEEQLIHSIMTSHRALEAEKSRSAANFACNVCFDAAKDPVVTSCGHLFCWPCLYQWLHLHCDRSECPVCKGQVIEANVTPIYGRGCLETTVEEKLRKDRYLGVKIPPRPRGNRVESLWPIDEDMHGGVRFEGGLLHGFMVGVISRLREWRMQREEGNAESGSNTNNSSEAQTNFTSSLLRDEIRNLYQPSSSDRLAAISDLGRVVARIVRGGSQAGASASSVNHRDPESLAADQASASSTVAVRQGDVAVNDPPAEPYSTESSRRGRSNSSGSLDADGGAFHAWKRRRIN